MPARTHQAIRDAVCESLAHGTAMQHAAAAAGVALRTVYDWIEADPAYAAKVEIARDRAADIVVKRIMNALDDCDPRQKHNILKLQWQVIQARWPDQYAERRQIKVEGSVDHVARIDTRDPAAALAEIDRLRAIVEAAGQRSANVAERAAIVQASPGNVIEGEVVVEADEPPAEAEKKA